MLYLDPMPSFLRRVFKGTVIAFVVLPVLVFLERTTLFSDLDRLTFDYTIDQVGLSPPSPQIVLVDFDEDTFQHIRQYPIPRSLFADAINRIAAGRPRVIGLDILLSEARTPADDQAMQDALTFSGVVIVASQAASGTLPAVTPLSQFCQPENGPGTSGFCVDGAPGALADATVNLPIDSDGFIRQEYLFTVGTPPALSFPLMLAQQYAGQSIQPGDRDHAMFLGHKLRYSDPELKTFLIGTWSHEPATRIPGWKLLAGEVPASAFADKLVLIGQTSSAASDSHFTPLFRIADKDGVRLKMGGTAIHAAAIRTLLEGRTVELTPGSWYLVWIVAITSVAATLVLACDLSLSLITVIGLMVAVDGLSLLLYARLRLWLPILPAEAALALALPFTLGVRFVEERLLSREAHAQREQLMGLFSSYVDPNVAETIWQRRSELSLGGEEHIATVMFTDIRGFTALSNSQPPEVVLRWLNRYVVAMDEVIRAHGGFLNKFIGDGLMIIFGLPLGHGPRQDARLAVEASLAMLARVETLNAERSVHPEFPHLRIGIGIHTGSLVAGSIGSAHRQEYSVIGETVNLASRLEGLNKAFGTEILMSAATMQLVAGLFPGLESLGDAKVAGLGDPVAVYTCRVTSMHEADLPAGARK
jgi:adenylate cyclase